MPLHAANAAEDPRLRIVASRRICASLLLQQLLYYQFYYDIAWISFWTVWLFHQYWHGLSYKDDDVVRTVFILFWLLAEPIRLAAGWYGNLQENVPWLVLFVILSVAPLQGTAFYILAIGYDNGPVARSVQLTQVILLEIELIWGIYAVRRLYKLQRKQFYLFEFAMGQRRKAAAVRPAPQGAGAAASLAAR